MKDRRKVKIVDTTLRDGEQSPGIVFSASDKVMIASALDNAGVEWIEAGVPIMGKEEEEALKQVLAAPLKAKMIAWNRAVTADILASVRCGFSYVHISVPISDLHIKEKIKKTRKWVLEELEQAILLAQSFGCTVSVGAEDAGRADREFFLQVAQVAANRGAIHIRFADTVGCLTPVSTAELFSFLLPRCSLPIEVHMHNDFGLASANTVVALTAGASMASTTIAGIGERAGNAGLGEVVMALYDLYGMDSGVDIGSLESLRELVIKLSGRKKVPEIRFPMLYKNPRNACI